MTSSADVHVVSAADLYDSDLDDDALDRLVGKARPKNTHRNTKWGLNRFNGWCLKRKIDVDLHTVTALDLAQILRKFYGELRSQSGDVLSPSSLTGIRAALHRVITSPPLSRSINIISDREFMQANVMFITKCKLYNKEGNPRPKHKPSIGEGDMQLLTTYFEECDTPKRLQQYVWFMLCYYFGRRGREGWTTFKKSTLAKCQDDEGHDYLSFTQTEQTKNHQGGGKQSEQDYADQRIYGQPVQAYELYISKLNPECDRLFQAPIVKYCRDGMWYQNKPLGKNMLSQMMINISNQAGLSQKYTNHSVGVSTVTNLFQAGMSAEKICSITKHKNQESLKPYISDLSAKQKRECNDVLRKSLPVAKVCL